jgi:DNA-binding NarL/FixJ family response regulator
VSARPPVRVVVVDDQEVVRAGFAALLDTQPDLTVVGTAADGLTAVRVCQEQRPDVLLMDVRMPRMDGIEATRQILSTSPGPPPRSAARSRDRGSGGRRAADPHVDHLRPRRARL